MPPNHQIQKSKARVDEQQEHGVMQSYLEAPKLLCELHF
jgi:hypothetical protein